jgi:hypothetical protein
VHLPQRREGRGGARRFFEGKRGGAELRRTRRETRRETRSRTKGIEWSGVLGRGGEVFWIYRKGAEVAEGREGFLKIETRRR